MQLTIAILVAALGAALFAVFTSSGPAGPMREAANKLEASRLEALQMAFPDNR